MMAQTVVVSFVLSLMVSMVLLSRLGIGLALDRPNERSLHDRPIPRTGGIAVLAGAGAGLALGGASLWLPMALAGFLAALSLLDDVRGLPALVRLAAHLSAASLLVWSLAGPMHPAQLVVLAVAVAWITNLYNFMDGSDGLAGGMTIIGFGTYGIAAGSAGLAALAALCAGIAAAAAAFLILNFHPARIFLGDVGSIPLGFLAAGLGLVGWRDAAWPLWFPLLVFAPFIGDATITLLKRLALRKRVWEAHRDHYYQRMVRMGLGHRGTAWISYAAMAACAGAALAGRDQPPGAQAAIFAGSCVLLAAVAAWVDFRWTRFTRSVAGIQ